MPIKINWEIDDDEIVEHIYSNDNILKILLRNVDVWI